MLWTIVTWVLGIFGGLIILSLLAMIIMGGVHRTRDVTPDPIPEGEDGVQYVGHGTTLVSVDGTKILTDPVLTNQIGVVIRRFVSPGINEETLKRVNVVLISHWHTDHYHPRSLKKLDRDIKLFVPEGLEKRLTRFGFKHVQEVRPGDVIDLEDLPGKLRINVVPTNHGTARGAVGYVIQGSWTVYFPGDTAFSESNMADIGSRFDLDLALLPIGCYRGRILGFIPISFRKIHMAPEQIPAAINLLHPKRVVPIHWGTFILGTEPIGEAPSRLKQIMREHHQQLPITLLKHGKWLSMSEF